MLSRRVSVRLDTNCLYFAIMDKLTLGPHGGAGFVGLNIKLASEIAYGSTLFAMLSAASEAGQ